MKLLTPNSNDIADIGLAIKSFDVAWGSINFSGVYEPMMNGKTLWLMTYYDVSDVKILYEETAPAKYIEMFQEAFEEERGILHAQASKIKTGFFSHAWVLKVTYMIDSKTFPVGFLGAATQAAVWTSFHNTLKFKGRFALTAETSLAAL